MNAILTCQSSPINQHARFCARVLHRTDGFEGCTSRVSTPAADVAVWATTVDGEAQLVLDAPAATLSLAAAKATIATLADLAGRAWTGFTIPTTEPLTATPPEPCQPWCTGALHLDLESDCCSGDLVEPTPGLVAWLADEADGPKLILVANGVDLDQAAAAATLAALAVLVEQLGGAR